MSFSFKVAGHAGDGMPGNSQEEADAVKAVATAALKAAKKANLNVTVQEFSPVDWHPDIVNTYEL